LIRIAPTPASSSGCAPPSPGISGPPADCAGAGLFHADKGRWIRIAAAGQINGQVDHVLWYREEFVVILSERGTHADGGPDAYLLKTAFCTFREHQKRKKRRARDGQ